MAKITEKMAHGIKDTMAVIIAEITGTEQVEVRSWLDSVNSAEEFFGNNRQGRAEYEQFIQTRENEYNRALKKSLK